MDRDKALWVWLGIAGVVVVITSMVWIFFSAINGPSSESSGNPSGSGFHLTPVSSLADAEQLISPENASRVTQIAILGTAHPVDCVTFSPDRLVLMSCTGDSVLLWEISTGVLRTIEISDHRVRAATFSPTGVLVAAESEDKAMRLWRVADGTLLRIREESVSPVLSIAFSSDGETLALGSWDRTVRLWWVRDI